MFSFLTAAGKRKEQKKALMAFYEEVDRNLESYYVMFQLNRLRFFSLEQWDQVRNRPDVDWPPDVGRYAQVLADYNTTLKDFKDYEQWYSADVENKTRENGQVLHTKREAAEEKFRQGLEDLIKNAKGQVERQLMDKGIIKHPIKFLRDK